MNIQKGDYIVYRYAFKIREAKVLKAYDGGYYKVRHTDLWILSTRDIVSDVEVLGVSKKLSNIRCD